MGQKSASYSGATFLSLLTETYGRNIGLYRDDGLAALNAKPHEIEKIKTELCKVFPDNDLKITVEANKTKVNFLDVTLDLGSEKYWPYTKEGNIQTEALWIGASAGNDKICIRKRTQMAKRQG